MSQSEPLDQERKREASRTPRFFSPESVIEPGAGPMPVLVAGIHLRSGDLCPQCQSERLDYDGLLNLTCPKCGFTPGGGCFS